MNPPYPTATHATRPQSCLARLLALLFRRRGAADLRAGVQPQQARAHEGCLL